MIKLSSIINTFRLLPIHNYYFVEQKIAKKRSYYEILELKQNFSEKQLRKSFLAKARKCHPDHNQSAQASQEFKLIKQAYQVLKDPQKRYMYDTGVSVTSEQVAPVPTEQSKSGKKYYQNKWYGYTKKNEYDLRDEYYQAKAEQFQQDKITWTRRAIAFIFILVSIFGYDILSKVQTKESFKREKVKSFFQHESINENPKQKRKKLLLQKYIQTRSEVNRVDL